MQQAIKRLDRTTLNSLAGKDENEIEELVASWFVRGTEPELRFVDMSDLCEEDYHPNRITLITEHGIVMSATTDIFSMVEYWDSRMQHDPEVFMPDGMEEFVLANQDLLL